MELSGYLHATAALPQGKELSLPIEYEAVWAAESVCSRGENTNILFLLGTESRFLARPTRSRSLYQPSYPGSA
jgi:hypothetical protein